MGGGSAGACLTATNNTGSRAFHAPPPARPPLRRPRAAPPTCYGCCQADERRGNWPHVVVSLVFLSICAKARSRTPLKMHDEISDEMVIKEEIVFETCTVGKCVTVRVVAMREVRRRTGHHVGMLPFLSFSGKFSKSVDSYLVIYQNS